MGYATPTPSSHSAESYGPSEGTKQEQTQTQKEESKQSQPLMSFEEWQRKIMQIENDKDRRHLRKTLRQQMVDSIDGGFSDDFGSMLEDFIGGVVGKEQTPNVYDEGEYISPSHSGSTLHPEESTKNSYKKKQQFDNARMKSLKGRFNYASTDCAATVRKANKEAKGAQSILYESKDQYLLNKCVANKFVIINLCEQIVIDTLVMANFEFFSSTFKDFRVYASSKYPSNDWRLLGQWQARNTRDLQVFKIPESGFVEYIKIEFLTHYGHEYYCPLSLVRVHGMSMMEYYTMVESEDRDPVLESEHLWPAEVREQIIQPQFDVVNTSETFPVKLDIEEEEDKLVIPPINMLDGPPTSILDELITSQSSDSIMSSPSSNTISTSLSSQAVDSLSSNSPVAAPSVTSKELGQPIVVSPNKNNSVSTTTTTTTMVLPPLASSPSIAPLLQPSPQPSKIVLPNNHLKEGNTQESIYKTIMKRLSILEVNMTLSQRFLEDQNKNLNDVFMEMEKKHQEQLIMLIGHLNETASHKIDSMVSEYAYTGCICELKGT
ncbi:MAG: UNC-like C-terminal-domain-containing protein [Benjaminiella poitrasii]|nr:MAG: UNC-like C-terminal-domain-containing protein [Benjaminiella poitrasii]